MPRSLTPRPVCRTARARFILVALAGLACSGEPPTRPPSAVPASITLTPATTTLRSIGERVTVSASVRDASGAPLPVQPTWSTSAPEVATVLVGGIVEAVANGTATITARAGTVSTSMTVTVAQAVATLEFRSQPRDVVSGGDPGPIAVAFTDARGHVVLTAGGVMTLGLRAPAGATLTGAPPRAAVNGVATWTGLALEGPGGESLVLTASAGAWQAESRSFDVAQGLDVLQFRGAGGAEIGALVDGWSGGHAVDDLGFRWSDSTVAVGIVRAGVSNEIMSFARQRAPILASAIPWTAGVDTVTLLFPAPVSIDLAVWIVRGPFEEQRQRAVEALATTAAIWDVERAGLEIGAVEFVDATGHVASPTFFALTLCNSRAAMEAQIGKRPGRVNVYYVQTVDGGTGRGRACDIGGDHLIMAERAGDELLSHELGHAFSLLHIDDRTTLFNQTNVMHSASSSRRYLTEAQIFRQHFESISALRRTYGAWPAAPSRSCGNFGSVTCPRIELRLWDDGGFPANALGPLATAPEATAPQTAAGYFDRACLTGEPDQAVAALRAGLTRSAVEQMVVEGPPARLREEAIDAALERQALRQAFLRQGGWPGLAPADRERLLRATGTAQRAREAARIENAWRSLARHTLERLDPAP